MEGLNGSSTLPPPVCLTATEPGPRTKVDDSKGSGTGKSDATWRHRLNELRRYKEEHGDCLVPARYAENRALGHWVMTQRRQYILMNEGKPSSLTKQRVLDLEDLDFTWTVRENTSDVWDRRLNELSQYKARYGDCLVPQRFPANPALGTWVNTQRRHYKLMMDGKKSSMSKERMRALEALGFEWKSPKKGGGSVTKKKKEANESSKEEDDDKKASSTTFEQPVWQGIPAQGHAMGGNVPVPTVDARYPPAPPPQMDYALLPQPFPQPHGPPQILMPPPQLSVPHQQLNGFGSVNNLNVSNGTWICQFCRMSLMGSFMDLRAHEAGCASRSYLLTSSANASI